MMPPKTTVYEHMFYFKNGSSVNWEERVIGVNEEGKVIGADKGLIQWLIDKDDNLFFVGNEGDLYRVGYDGSKKPQISKAKNKEGELRWFFYNIEHFEHRESIRDYASYQTMVASLKEWRGLQSLTHQLFFFLEKIREREVDAVQRMQLMGGGTEAQLEADFIRFNQQLLSRYQEKVYKDVEAILAAYSQVF